MNIVWLVIFWLMQAAAQVLFKYGSLTPSRWLLGFIAGNVFGASSIWFLMLLYKSMNPCLALGLGTGAVFKLVAEWFPTEVGAVTGVVGAAGGLGGFFPPLAMALVKSLWGNYIVGFVLLAGVAAGCLAVLTLMEKEPPTAPRQPQSPHQDVRAPRAQVGAR